MNTEESINEVIILAGGLGTRLKSAVPDLPKCMAPVAGKPFLSYVIDHCLEQGLNRFIFSLGYKHETVEDYLSDKHSLLDMEYVIEEEPLGTGGAIQLAIAGVAGKDVLILNGDTLFKFDLPSLQNLHSFTNADCTLALKPMQKFDRYGVVRLDDDKFITSFEEKKFYSEGLINAGAYCLNTERFRNEKHPDHFSFEKDYLEPKAGTKKLSGLVQEKYFIDIGIPADFERAQLELSA
ncbi:MAG: nucleotidyltransferase family protein [Chitinophagaceae bacterium]|nr:nucleotidyltransferase family protein [Chitinophagaceae bacterium]